MWSKPRQMRIHTINAELLMAYLTHKEIQVAPIGSENWITLGKYRKPEDIKNITVYYTKYRIKE